ncbi:hypothetical protein [Ohtaekwangia koreensis]|uniref:Uncharacterized protein n=1 Tax=Ohtaekwangia koreensis TaxID=688867 RepID=A0A1T5KFS2_9BACT|nr:hypothetical protein [Ohtaekwangia koreensis]SKC62517.1 hypothetical protein SAMN05660236_2134 [Ohtaekwangia koreensis]
MKKAIDFLRSEVFIFLTLLLVITSQIIHTMYLFETVRVFDLSFEIASYRFTIANWVHAFIFALAIEAAILMFILNGKPTPSKVYAVASFATNLLYYKVWMVPLPTIFASVLISSMLAGSIWFFSDLLAEKISMADVPSKEEDELKKILAATDEVKKINFKTTMPMNGR